MKINKGTVALAREYAEKTFAEKLSPAYHYHNLAHTQCVADATEEIARAEGINNHERHILLTAAWLHDLGYTNGPDEHELVATHIATGFLELHEVDAPDIQAVNACILATRYPQQPATHLEKIICDADLAHLGKKSFFDSGERIRKEWESCRGLQYDDEQWRELSLKFLDGHHFHTHYCRQKYENRKQKNRQKLEKMCRAVTETIDEKIKLHRGVETLFRTASRNHMQLSSMADSKAHILMSINSIIISIIISVLLKKLEESTYLVFPTILLLLVCTVSVVFAVLTTKPKISKGVFTKDQVARREVNLMFFGNFHKMELNTYNWGIREMMADANYLYDSMTKDIYFMGKILAVKYRYLSVGYMVFMIGIVASVVSFGVAFACR